MLDYGDSRAVAVDIAGVEILSDLLEVEFTLTDLDLEDIPLLVDGGRGLVAFENKLVATHGWNLQSASCRSWSTVMGPVVCRRRQLYAGGTIPTPPKLRRWRYH